MIDATKDADNDVYRHLIYVVINRLLCLKKNLYRTYTGETEFILENGVLTNKNNTVNETSR